MTIDEFLALKEGDRISNPMTNSSGTVAGILHDRRELRDGVLICVLIEWDGSAGFVTPFTKHSTAWMHWTAEAAS